MIATYYFNHTFVITTNNNNIFYPPKALCGPICTLPRSRKNLSNRTSMKRLIIAIAFVATLSCGFAQQVSSRAKAIRMMNYARPEYMVKDIKVYTDTMTVISLCDNVIYPLGKWGNVEDYITDNKLHWYREVGYKNFYDSMTVSVNTVKRLDGSYVDLFRSITTSQVEILGGKLTDPEVVLTNGLHAGVAKGDVFNVFFKKFPKSYISDICVLKVVSGAGEVMEIYTFKGNKLRHIEFRSKYKYY